VQSRTWIFEIWSKIQLERCTWLTTGHQWTEIEGYGNCRISPELTGRAGGFVGPQDLRPGASSSPRTFQIDIQMNPGRADTSLFTDLGDFFHLQGLTPPRSTPPIVWKTGPLGRWLLCCWFAQLRALQKRCSGSAYWRQLAQSALKC
jgi:hypothetical protein